MRLERQQELMFSTQTVSHTGGWHAPHLPIPLLVRRHTRVMAQDDEVPIY